MKNIARHNIVDPTLAILIGLIGFLMIVGVTPLDPTNILWLVSGSSDTSTHYIGWTYFLADEWRWPLGNNPNYGLELSSSVIFSDSIPLMAILFKLLSPILPEPFQYTGWWVLLCFFLQSFFAIRITHLFSKNYLIKIFTATILIFSPPLLYRLGAHFSLFPHWIILASILIYFADSEDNTRRKVKWGILLVCASLSHLYFVPMVLIIWLADVYQRCQIQKLHFFTKWPEALLMFFIILTALWVAGFFPLEKSYLSGGYGIHRLNLLALINPHGVSSVPGDTWSYIMPSLPQGYGDYEGFNFLGTGSLLLVLVGTFFLIRSKIRFNIIQKIIPIIVGATFLTLFSISNKIGVGSYSIEIWIPDILIRLGNIMRASGRFFWPVYYLIVLGSIFLVSNNLDERKTLLLLLLLTSIQILDTKKGWQQFEHKFQTSGAEWETNYDHPDLNILAKHYTKLRALPLINAGKDWDKRSQFALKHDMQTDAVYLSRYTYDSIGMMEKIKNRIYSKDLDSDSLYFLTKEIAELVYPYMKTNDALFYFDEDVYIYAPNWSITGQKIHLPLAKFK